jgi:hypothetical protein
MGTRSLKQRRGYGWAWEFKPLRDADWELCNWAAPSLELLEMDESSKPCDDARAVRVELVPTTKSDRQRYGY